MDTAYWIIFLVMMLFCSFKLLGPFYVEWARKREIHKNHLKDIYERAYGVELLRELEEHEQEN